MLARRAMKLFSHVKDALVRATLDSSIGADYSSVLRTSLLTNAHYCSLVPASSFQGLFSLPWLVKHVLSSLAHNAQGLLGGLSHLACIRSRICPSFT